MTPTWSRLFTGRPPAASAGRPAARRKPPFRPRLETLEQRLVPEATLHWDGGALLSNNWSNPKNWREKVAPAPGDNLVFPSAVSDTTADNDFPNGTLFRSISFTGDGYVLKGNRIRLGAGGIVQTVEGLTNEIRLDIALEASSGPITIGTSGGAPVSTTVAITGVLSGVGSLNKEGAGILELFGDNTYTGMTVVHQGTLSVGHDRALGSTVSDTLVLQQGELKLLAPNVFGVKVSEALTFEGGRLTAETSSFPGIIPNLEVAGPVRLLVNDLDVRSILGSLTISGPIRGVRGLDVTGGEVRLEGDSSNTYEGPTVVGSRTLDNHAALLILNKTNGATAIPGPLVVGDISPFTNEPKAGTVQLKNKDQISDTATVQVNLLGQLDLNGHDDRIASLDLHSSSVTTDRALNAGLLDVAGNLSAVSEEVGTPASISGHLRVRGEIIVSDGPAPSDLVVSAVIPSGGVTKDGPGTLLITGNVGGKLDVLSGVLRFHGRGADLLSPPDVEVHGGAAFAGNGTVRNLIVRTGARVRPGPLSSTGVLTVRGFALLEPGSTLNVTLNGPVAGSGHDQLDVTGLVTVAGATLQALVGTGAQVGDQFRIIENGSQEAVVGTFQGLPEGATFSSLNTLPLPVSLPLSITYAGGFQANDVVLTRENVATKAEDLALPASAVEGERVTLTGRLTDPDPGDRLTLVVDWGDGSRPQTFHPGTAPFDLGHAYADDGAYTVHLRWFDRLGAGNGQDLAVTVRNAAPQVSAGPDEDLGPGGALGRRGRFADPGRDAWSAVVDYGDGTGPQPLALQPNGAFRLQHRYGRPGTYQVTVTVRDDDGGAGTATFTVRVPPRRRDAPPDAAFALLGER